MLNGWIYHAGKLALLFQRSLAQSIRWGMTTSGTRKAGGNKSTPAKKKTSTGL